ncbi:uncharacterized protein LOC108665881, partial [Hyalella azteca]|uniref:Uncharacterized protein LOC108665881 n=1 Tax=Hyalella azteca TaxID=294128 RepID=A0A8B7N2U7_HYAAZ
MVCMSPCHASMSPQVYSHDEAPTMQVWLNRLPQSRRARRRGDVCSVPASGTLISKMWQPTLFSLLALTAAVRSSAVVHCQPNDSSCAQCQASCDTIALSVLPECCEVYSACCPTYSAQCRQCEANAALDEHFPEYCCASFTDCCHMVPGLNLETNFNVKQTTNPRDQRVLEKAASNQHSSDTHHEPNEPLETTQFEYYDYPLDESEVDGSESEPASSTPQFSSVQHSSLSEPRHESQALQQSQPLQQGQPLQKARPLQQGQPLEQSQPLDEAQPLDQSQPLDQ